ADTLADHAPLIGIKCGHHGAATSTSSHFLAKTKPRGAFISAARNNTYEHPHVLTLTRLASEPSVECIVSTSFCDDRPFFNPSYCHNTKENLKLIAAEAVQAIKEFCSLDVGNLHMTKWGNPEPQPVQE